jgi:type I restriction enzyme S subunit
MTSEWDTKPLGEIVSLVIDYRGKTPKKLGGDWSIRGIKALSAKNIKTREIVQPDTIRYVDSAMYKAWMKEEIQRGDILITSEAPFGEVFYWDSDEKIVLSQRLFAVRCKSEYYSPFIFQYMTSKQFQGELRGRATGTTVTGLRQSELLKCLIAFPKYEEQVAIAETLSLLDARIAVNKEINHHLEQLAQAIFKSWFVDFEPWGGEMPSDWREGTIADTCSAIYNGGTPRRNEPLFWDGTIPWLTSGEVRQAIIIKPQNCISEAGLKGSSAKWVPTLSTVVALYGATAGQVSMVAAPLTTNQAICTLVPKENHAFYNFLVMRNAVTQLENKAIGSAQQNISKAIVKETPCLIADNKAVTVFDKLVSPLINKWVQNLLESAHLVVLRDTLLPRLMSGELSVADLGDAK